MGKREQPSSARSLDTSAEEATARSSQLHIETIAEFERNFLQQQTLPGRIADAIGKFAGSFTSVILHGLWFGGWVFINLGMVLGIQPFDEFPFYTLQLLVALEAIFLSTFVLMRQNRLDTLGDQRARLALQINLLAEKETTKILQMLQSICDRLDLKELAQDKETRRLSEETHLETLARELKEKLPGEHK